MAERLRGLGDLRSAAIVTRIAEEELAHVAVGVDWFLRLCTQSGQAPGEAFEGKGMGEQLLGVGSEAERGGRRAQGAERRWRARAFQPRCQS